MSSAPPPSDPILDGVSPIASYASVPVPEIPAEWTNGEIFALRVEELGPFLRLMVMIRVLFGFLITAAVLAVVYFAGVYRSTFEFMVFGAILVGIMMVVNVTRIAREVTKLRRTWRVFRVVLAEEGMIICSGDRASVRIERTQVVRIVETWDSFRIFVGATAATLPKRVESPESVRMRLGKWRSIERGKGAAGAVVRVGGILLLSIVNVIVFYIGFIAVDGGRIVACMVVTLVLSGLSILRIFRERTYPRATKVRSLLQLVLPAALLVRLYFLK